MRETEGSSSSVPYCGEQCLSGICYSSWKHLSEQPTELSNIGMTTKLELDALPSDKLREMKIRELIEEHGADVEVHSVTKYTQLKDNV